MPYRYLDIASTPAVRAAQIANGSRTMWESLTDDRDSSRFGPDEIALIETRDTFYLATVSETGWPYVQHRGGPPGFLKVLGDATLGFADFRGNLQYISLGNIAADDRVSLILMDYPSRIRLKIMGHMTAHDLRAEPDLAERLALPDYKAKPERGLVIRLEAFDWNCAQHITPRYTALEISAATQPLRARIAELEAENHALRDQIAAGSA